MNKKRSHSGRRRNNSEEVSAATGKIHRVSARTRDIVSIALIAHLCVVFVTLSAAWSPSPLQVRLLSLFAPYTVSTGLDLEQRPLYFTHGRSIDMEHRLQLSGGDGEALVVIENAGMALGERHKRRARIAALPVRLEEFQNTDGAAALAASVAQKLLSEADVSLGRVGVLRNVPVPVQDTFPPPLQEELAYEAAVITGENGVVQVSSLSETSQNAIPVQEPTEGTGR